MEDFASRLKELRTDKKLSQEVLASKVNISPASIRHWENRVHQPTAPHIITLAKYFGVSTDYLLGLTDS